MTLNLTPAERELVATQMLEIVESMQDEYGPDEQRAVALASSVIDKLRACHDVRTRGRVRAGAPRRDPIDPLGA